MSTELDHIYAKFVRNENFFNLPNGDIGLTVDLKLSVRGYKRDQCRHAIASFLKDSGLEDFNEKLERKP